jgi:hypothetical protein
VVGVLLAEVVRGDALEGADESGELDLRWVVDEEVDVIAFRASPTAT